MNKNLAIPITLILIVLNLSIMLAVQSFNIWHVNNYNQALFKFGWLSFIIILSLGLIVTNKLELYKKYPIVILVILAGIVSNILEKLYRGFAVDYIDFGIGVANLADIQIYFGGLFIVYKELIITKLR